LAWWFLTRRFFKFQPFRTCYWPWQPCWISDLHQKHKSGRGPSNEHIWQVWLKSVQRFQRRRVKCEKLTDRQTLTHDKSSHGLWPGELKKKHSTHLIKHDFCYAWINMVINPHQSVIQMCQKNYVSQKADIVICSKSKER
jgi:hypothetical protein